uniref:Reverse transcriptase domain-containing protein n=1 Tax=Oncorhynchus kisutch TaxID=8019 RepID=A0A8C7INA6_ONCKI
MSSIHFPTQSVQTGGSNLDPRMLPQGHGREEQSLEERIEREKLQAKIRSQTSERKKKKCKTKHCLEMKGLWNSGPKGEKSPPRKRGICETVSFQDTSQASDPDPPNDLKERRDVGSVASQCVGEIKTPALASWDGGRDVVMPPQPVHTVENSKEASTLASHSIVPTGAQLFLLPVRDVICGRCGRALSTIGSTVKHFAVVHPEVQVLFGCRACGKSSENSHSISCHIPKCRGVVETRMELDSDHICGHCPARFATAVGLTQHKRHRHIAIYCMEKERGQTVGMKKIQWIENKKKGVERRKLTLLSDKLAGMNSTSRQATDSQATDSTVEGARLIRRELRYGKVQNDALQEATEELLPKPGTPPTPQTGLRGILRGALTREATYEGVQIGEVKLSLRGVEQDPTLLASSALELQRLLGGGAGSRARLNQSRERRPALPSEGMGETKTTEYHRIQLLYENNRSRLGEYILDGNVGGTAASPPLEVALAFKSRWEVTESYHGLGQFCSREVADNRVFQSLISAAEVGENLKAIKNGTAAGPDGITKKGIKDWDPSGAKLAVTFSTWLTAGTLPEPFKKCRTTLIPKTSDPVLLTQEAGWRPLTIGSLVLRLYSRILTHRLARACPISPRQRGFISSPGCSENLMILGGLIKRSRREGEMLAVVLVDFARAFDSVSHLHILEALGQRGLDEHIIGIVKDAYTGVTTSIKVNEERFPPVGIRVGVKQGDPMSPLLFNLALNPLIDTLERYGLGYELDDQQITTLAFADDLVLVSGSWAGMAHNILILEEFCNRTGLRIQPGKCHGFLTQKTRRARLINLCEPWIMCGERLHMVGPEESVAYLGMRVSPWYGIMEPEPVERLRNWIRSIGRSPLKPSQKVKMLSVYAIPRMVYRADHGGLGPRILEVLDGMIRKAVKVWLHLPQCTCDGLLYSKCQDGGLGIVKLACHIPSIQVRRVYRLWHSDDAVTRIVTRRTVVRKEYLGMWLRAGGEGASLPPLEEERGSAVQGTDPAGSVRPSYPGSPSWRQAEYLKWQNLTSQGIGVQAFGGDKNSNHWLANPETLGSRERHYIAGLQLRANVYPTREALSRGRMDRTSVCRHCLLGTESCSHILGQCPAVKDSRIRRHHNLCELLANEAESAGWIVTREMCCRTRAGALRRPDLVFVKNENALVVDVTVRYEMAYDTLMVAAAEKVARYKPITLNVMAALKVKKVKVFGFPLGARGKWPDGNGRLLRALGVSRSRERRLAKLFSRRTLLYSLDVLRDFYRLGEEAVDSDDESEDSHP